MMLRNNVEKGYPAIQTGSFCACGALRGSERKTLELKHIFYIQKTLSHYEGAEKIQKKI